MIAIVGLGPGPLEWLSLGAWEALKGAPRVYARTRRHPTVPLLEQKGIEFESFDAVYESARTFENVYKRIVRTLLARAKAGESVVYAVPGHPLVAEASVSLLMKEADRRRIPVRIVGSASFLEPAIQALRLDIDRGLKLLDALDLGNTPPSPEVGNLIFQVYDRRIASQVKLALMARHYPGDTPVFLVAYDPEQGRNISRSLPLHEIDRYPVDHLTSLYLPSLPPEAQKTFDRLAWIISELRSDHGCPWDREQTHDSLLKYVVEETYEVVEAVEAADPDRLCEELGDFLMQAVLQAQIASEEGYFDIYDVLHGVTEKLIRRHPHVFGDVEVENSDDVLRNWDKIKKDEKAGEEKPPSVLHSIPRQLPALMRALEVSKRAARTGFEWDSIEGVFAKLDEELAELQAARESDDRQAVFEEIGDILFTVVNIARFLKIEPEDALQKMINRFNARFESIEAAARESGRTLEEMSLEEMEAVWQASKSQG
ncbi:MAG: nucleoside triphosphate pyrophosphohydrolase [Armatimonadetes bacterium]|nr:nucleoside triphosphate pyrophosphohydrolase [Armatimonadota bacterium]